MLLSDGSAAIDYNRVSGDIAGGRRCKKHCDTFQLTFRANSTHRDSRLDQGLLCGKNLLGHPRWKEAWSNRVHANAPARPFSREFAGHRDQSALRRDVGDDVLAGLCRTAKPGHRSYINDVAASALEHFATRTLRKQKRASQIDLQHHIPFLKIVLFNWLAPGYAGVINQDVDLTVGLEGAIDGCLDIRWVRHITQHAFAFETSSEELFDRRSEPLLTSSEQH